MDLHGLHSFRRWWTTSSLQRWWTTSSSWPRWRSPPGPRRRSRRTPPPTLPGCWGPGKHYFMFILVLWIYSDFGLKLKSLQRNSNWQIRVLWINALLLNHRKVKQVLIWSHCTTSSWCFRTKQCKEISYGSIQILWCNFRFEVQTKTRFPCRDAHWARKLLKVFWLKTFFVIFGWQG